MHTTCLIDHSLEIAIPRDLCRACHPELNMRAVNAEEELLCRAEEAARLRQLSFQGGIAA
jgi:hypothetical protein